MFPLIPFTAARTKSNASNYNCSSLSNQVKIRELENESRSIKKDVIGIIEIRRKSKDLIELNSGNSLYYKGKSTGRTSRVGFLMSNK